ncbi:hypothetical protein [Parasitella parasitica]|uniref:Uncharacterized protein n=1 Tax=Parasitella parasitica TaxID=35722 RepID=A0A0B7MWQ7_9FUNG|nr:hypothetical protein [Parasitella parasitica]
MLDEEQEFFSALQALKVQPDYSWTPSPALKTKHLLDTPLFTALFLSDDEFKQIIERIGLPPINNLLYQPPDCSNCSAKYKTLSVKANYDF